MLFAVAVRHFDLWHVLLKRQTLAAANQSLILSVFPGFDEKDSHIV